MPPILSLAESAGAKRIVIHDLSIDETFFYESFPEVKFFSDRNKLRKKISISKTENCFEQAKIWSKGTGWRIVNDEPLDFVYETADEVQSLCAMELSLDLIESYFCGTVSQFDDLVEEFKIWAAHSERKVRVKGCSHWMALSNA